MSRKHSVSGRCSCRSKICATDILRCACFTRPSPWPASPRQDRFSPSCPTSMIATFSMQLKGRHSICVGQITLCALLRLSRRECQRLVGSKTRSHICRTYGCSMFDLDESRPDSQAAHRAEPESDAEVLDSYSATVTGAVEKAGPAVVNIAVTTPQGRGGAGSGFLVSADGLIFTNSHV